MDKGKSTMKKGYDLKHSMLLSEKRTHLAQKRTELAHERTIMANVRTATTLTLFGIAFFGFSKIRLDMFYIAGIIAVTAGIILGFFAIERAVKHSKEINRIKSFFERIAQPRHGKPL